MNRRGEFVDPGPAVGSDFTFLETHDDDDNHDWLPFSIKDFTLRTTHRDL